jgi:hypothetical protein
MDPKWLVEGQANEEACTCGECLMLMDQPTSGCSQGHCLCHACYVRILEEATPAQSVCPVCKEKTSRKKLIRIRPLESVIGNLLICKHAAGCDWSGTVSQLRAHVESCPLEPVPCPNPGCEERVARNDMEIHAEACNFYKYECKHCKSTTKECRFGLEPSLLPLPELDWAPYVYTVLKQVHPDTDIAPSAQLVMEVHPRTTRPHDKTKSTNLKLEMYLDSVSCTKRCLSIRLIYTRC